MRGQCPPGGGMLSVFLFLNIFLNLIKNNEVAILSVWWYNDREYLSASDIDILGVNLT